MFSLRNVLGVAACCLAAVASAQLPETAITESSAPMEDGPLDEITHKTLTDEKPILPYDPIREADIFWEKRIWRVIDTREKMNQMFSFPARPFATILIEAALDGEITVYNTENDRFTIPLTPEEVAAKTSSMDTLTVYDPETYEEEIQVVFNELNPEDIKRFRVKEVWFFDEESSTMQVRILGIAPLLDKYDENGNFQYEMPLFWAYYPDARGMLARERVFNVANDAAPTTWEDVLEMRYFSSFIWKESNVQDRRLEGYLSGVDLLLEGEKIKQEIFNFEQDLWTY